MAIGNSFSYYHIFTLDLQYNRSTPAHYTTYKVIHMDTIPFGDRHNVIFITGKSMITAHALVLGHWFCITLIEFPDSIGKKISAVQGALQLQLRITHTAQY